MTLNGQRVLVTGGAGAIGSHVVRIALARGASVAIVDDLSSGSGRNVPAGVDMIIASILEPVVATLVREADVLIHLAARFANQNSIDHPLADLATNAEGTLRLLEAVRGTACRMVYASTSCVTSLRTPYAISKLTGEQYVRFYGEQHGLWQNVVRYYNVYGPYDVAGPYRSVIPNWLLAARDGLPLTILGSGHETRDFTFAEDAAECTLRAAEVESSGHVFEIGTGRDVTIARLAAVITAATGSSSPIVHLPRRDWDTVTARRADPLRARHILGYAPETPIEDGIAATVAWQERCLPVTP